MKGIAREAGPANSVCEQPSNVERPPWAVRVLVLTQKSSTFDALSSEKIDLALAPFPKTVIDNKSVEDQGCPLHRHSAEIR